jgi:hypothetical protein
MLSNKYHMLDLVPFKKRYYQKVIHNMNNKIDLVLSDLSQIEISVLVIHNDLDYAKVRVILLSTTLLILCYVNE